MLRDLEYSTVLEVVLTQVVHVLHVHRLEDVAFEALALVKQVLVDDAPLQACAADGLLAQRAGEGPYMALEHPCQNLQLALCFALLRVLVDDGLAAVRGFVVALFLSEELVQVPLVNVQVVLVEVLVLHLVELKHVRVQIVLVGVAPNQQLSFLIL